MKKAILNVIALIIGLLVGGSINMAIITFGGQLVPPPSGVNVNDAQSIAAHIHEFKAQHFLVPFLAHALGTLAGACVAFLLGRQHRSVLAWVVGGVFLAGGIAAAFMIPAPAWFIALDLIIAYLPMAFLATRLCRRFSGGGE